MLLAIGSCTMRMMCKLRLGLIFFHFRQFADRPFQGDIGRFQPETSPHTQKVRFPTWANRVECADMQLRSTIIGNISEVCGEDWDALEGAGQPFLSHAFLGALERHDCVGKHWGWLPQHLLLHDGERLVAAMPQYLKSNSYGELVFDGSWAEAYRHSGLAYYPKLVAAVPYTPATGARLLIAPDVDRGITARALIEAAICHAETIGVSSLHCLFPSEIDRHSLAAQGLLIRTGCQFHWHNRGYTDFAHYLGHFTSAKRKNIRRERRQVRESGLNIRQYYGEQLSEAQWRIVHRHYATTFARLSGYATLSLAFFRDISQRLPGQVVIFLAEQAGRPVASAICLRDRHSLYGRHWGCDEHFDKLHFELCYYQGLDYCIRHGLQRFDPGAQGEHKISRGFLPTATWSAHWIAHPAFRSAIAAFLQHETRSMRNDIETLGEHTPFKRHY